MRRRAVMQATHRGLKLWIYIPTATRSNTETKKGAWFPGPCSIAPVFGRRRGGGGKLPAPSRVPCGAHITLGLIHRGRLHAQLSQLRNQPLSFLILSLDGQIGTFNQVADNLNPPKGITTRSSYAKRCGPICSIFMAQFVMLLFWISGADQNQRRSGILRNQLFAG
jgi:hypothetical protein